MADRRETHVWFDGEVWRVYTERTHDLDRFTLWFGNPSRLGRDGSCAHWDEVPKDALRIRRRVSHSSKPPTESQVRARERFAVARQASMSGDAVEPPKNGLGS